MNSRGITEGMISQMAKRSLKSSRMRNSFVMVAVALTSALLMVVLTFAMGQKKIERDVLSRRQQVGYYNLTEEQVARLGGEGRIACQVLAKQGVLSELDGFCVMPYYVSELSGQIQVGELESGRMPEAEHEIAVQAPLLEKMGASPKLGGSVSFTFYDGSAETFTVSGILKGGESEKQFSLFFSKSYAEEGSQLKDMPYEVYAQLCGATEMSAEACKETMYLIGSDAGVERKNIYPSKSFLDSLSVDMQSALAYGMVGVVVLFAGVLVIYGVFYLSVIGRVHQFGQLRTIGMSKKQVKKFVSKEGRALFLRSSPAGIGIGGAVGYLILPQGFGVVDAIMAAAAVFAAAYLITMASVRKPARIAAAVSPMEALRYLPQDGMAKPGNRKLCRRLTPFGLCVMNFSKNKKKAAITMLSLSLGGILFMAAATYISSFDLENYARQGYFVDAEFNLQYSASAIELEEYGLGGLQAKLPLGEGAVQQISAIDGVEGIQTVQKAGIRYDYPKRDEYGVDDVIRPMSEEEVKGISRYLEEGSADYGKLMGGDYVLVAGNGVAEEIYGWKFAVGDKVTLHFYDGSKTIEKEVEILGVLNGQYVIDSFEWEGWFLMPEQVILDFLPGACLNANLLVSAEEGKEEAVGEQLEGLAAGHAELILETLAERRVSYRQSASQMFGAVGGLAAFIMMFSILSMMNTLITNIMARKQELAMLESIGMGRGQVCGMLLGESLLLAFATMGVTMTVGTLCGYALCSVLYSLGAFYMAFRFPIVLALGYAAVLVSVPLAITFASMRSFSKEALVARLRGMEG